MQISNETVEYSTLNGKFQIKKFDITNSKNGKTHSRICFERGDSVAALVYDSDKGTFLFTKQFRIGSQSTMIEIPAGSMDKPGENPEDVLRRELMEELGVEIAPNEENGYCHFQLLGSFYVSPGGCSEKIHLYLVDKILRKEEGGGVGDEEIEIVELTIEETGRLFVERQFEDMRTVLSLQCFFSAMS